MDGSHHEGMGFVAITVTKRPLQEVYDDPEGFERVKAEFVGMEDGSDVRMLTTKLRTGEKDPRPARPSVAMYAPDAGTL